MEEETEKQFDENEDLKITEKKYTILDLLQKELNEYKDLYLRASADYQNLKKQSEKRYANSFFSGQNSVIEYLLPFFDDFDRMIVNDSDFKGMQIVNKELNDILDENYIERIEPVEGDVFDDSIHDAIMVVPANDKEHDNLIKNTIVKGYKHGDKIIRYAAVSVYKYMGE